MHQDGITSEEFLNYLIAPKRSGGLELMLPGKFFDVMQKSQFKISG